MKVLRAVCVIGAILMAAPGARAIEKGQSGIGFFGSAHVPILKFGDWYTVSPKVGVSYNYVVSSKIIAEVEYHYSKMRGGDLADRQFTWSVDGKSHSSPNVDQKMSFNSFAASVQLHLQELGDKGAAPYLLGGLGFFGFSNQVSGLIFPGQSGTTLDANMLLEPYEDSWPALTLTMGAGVSIVSSERFLIDLRGRYNIMMGELRPLEDWGLRKAFPLQAIDLSVGFKYFW